MMKQHFVLIGRITLKNVPVPGSLNELCYYLNSKNDTIIQRKNNGHLTYSIVLLVFASTAVLVRYLVKLHLAFLLASDKQGDNEDEMMLQSACHNAIDTST
jgi:hypothetical protein